MEFSKDLRDAVLAGDVTVTIRLWSRPKVKVGGRYRIGPGRIEVDTVERLVFAEIDETDLDRCGEADLEALRRRTARAGPVHDDTPVYRVAFHVVDDEAAEGRPHGDADGRAWVAGLPDALDGQRRAIGDLLLFCETSPAVTSLSVGCSLGRGAADALSDVDAAVGVNAARGEAGAGTLRQVEQELVDHVRRGRVVDLLRDEVRTGERLVRRVVAQLQDGVQLDLAVVAETEVRRGDSAPDFVTLYLVRSRAAASEDTAPMPSAYAVSAEQVRGWAFRAWWSLLDADKYIRRGSRWEAHQRLQEARQHIWALWASVLGTSYPWHGLSQVLDHQPASLPDRIEATVSGLGLDDLRTALRASVSVLDDVSLAAGRRHPDALPTALADFARTVIASGERQTRHHR
jgi:predicted nucleotidyltransferase